MASRELISDWFDSIGKPCPDVFEPLETIKQVPVYLDPDNSDYCPELALAIEICDAMYVKKDGNQSEGMTIQIEKYLNENYSKVSTALNKRMQTICNSEERKKQKIKFKKKVN